METIRRVGSRPYNETIVDLIKLISRNDSVEAMIYLTDFIIGTDIEAGHDEIVSAVENYWPRFGQQVVNRIKSHVLSQREIVATKTRLRVYPGGRL